MTEKHEITDVTTDRQNINSKEVKKEKDSSEKTERYATGKVLDAEIDKIEVPLLKGDRLHSYVRFFKKGTRLTDGTLFDVDTVHWTEFEDGGAAKTGGDYITCEGEYKDGRVVNAHITDIH